MLYKIKKIINVLGLFLVTVNCNISYFCYVVENSVCVVVGATKGDILHEDLVESLQKERKNVTFKPGFH